MLLCNGKLSRVKFKWIRKIQEFRSIRKIQKIHRIRKIQVALIFLKVYEETSCVKEGK